MASPGSVAASPLQSILAKFAAMPGFSCDFRETKRIAILRDPLVSRGSIYFAPPDRLARYVRTPVPSVVLLIGDRVSYDFKGDRGVLDIDSNPMIRSISSTFRLLLAGDTEALKRRFDMNANLAESGHWEIVLRPSRQPLSESIQFMRVSGIGTQLGELHIAERNGDETTMNFSAVDPARQFSDSEAAQIFRLPDS